MNVLINHHPEGRKRIDYMFSLIKLVNQARCDAEQEQRRRAPALDVIAELFFGLAIDVEKR